MANSLKTPPATEKAANGAKKYLDFAGLNALWDNICDKFAPQWKSVNFDHIAQTTPTHNVSDVTFTFQNLSMPPTADGVVDHTHVNQTNWTINAATQEKAGVMTAADKAKLDGIESTAENAVTVKTIMVGGGDDNVAPVALTISSQSDPEEDDYKSVAFGLNYDANTDLLSIVDLNNNKTALSSVHVLGDALKTLNGFDDIDVITKDGSTFIVFTLTVTDQNGDTQTKSIEINVNDLVSLYEAGDGIKLTITGNAIGTDNDTSTSTKIELVAPTRVSNDNKIGGIKSDKIYTGSVTNWKNTSGTTAPAIQDLGTQTGRYFGIETDKDGHAFVNAPSAAITTGTNTTDQGNVNSIDAPGSFTAITGVDITLSEDGSTYTYTTNTTTYTIAQESKLAIGTITDANADTFTVTNSDGVVDADNGHKITYINKVQVKDHTIDFETGEYTLKETPITINTDTAPESIVLTPGASASNVTVIKTITKDGHHVIQKEDVTISVADPEAIDIDYIEGLKWVVPITKLHYRNESKYETDADHQGGSTKTEIQD